MNVQKLNQAVQQLRNELADGLLATDIFTVADGLSLAGFNTQPQASALFNRVTDQINSTLQGSDFPLLNKYYILDLDDNKLVVILPLGEYRWGILCDGQKTKLGLLLNVTIPQIIKTFNEAIAG